MTHCTGIILAGGESRRYGRPKAFEKHEGAYFYEKAHAALKPWVERIVIQSSPDLVQGFDIGNVYTDIERWRGEGPLAGIYTAFIREEADWFLILPCDVPFIEPVVFEELIRWKRKKGITTPVALRQNERTHPLISIWEKKEKERVGWLLRQGVRSARRAFEDSRGRYADISELARVTGKHLHNVNTEEEYKKGSSL